MVNNAARQDSVSVKDVRDIEKSFKCLISMQLHILAMHEVLLRV
jgi:hypothetical protein